MALRPRLPGLQLLVTTEADMFEQIALCWVNRQHPYDRMKVRGWSRNDIIAEVIHELSGHERDRKQVASHIQVLKGFSDPMPAGLWWSDPRTNFVPVAASTREQGVNQAATSTRGQVVNHTQVIKDFLAAGETRFAKRVDTEKASQVAMSRFTTLYENSIILTSSLHSPTPSQPLATPKTPLAPSQHHHIRPDPPPSQPRQPLLPNRIPPPPSHKHSFLLRPLQPRTPALLHHRTSTPSRRTAPLAHHIGGRLHAPLTRIAAPAHSGY